MAVVPQGSTRCLEVAHRHLLDKVSGDPFESEGAVEGFREGNERGQGKTTPLEVAKGMLDGASGRSQADALTISADKFSQIHPDLHRLPHCVWGVDAHCFAFGPSSLEDITKRFSVMAASLLPRDLRRKHMRGTFRL